MTQSPDLSIVIVSYQVCALLEQCLTSLYALRGSPRLEIFVVDNASTDGSPERVRQGFPDVRLIANTANRGFAAANNQGLRESTGRYVMLLNPDTVLPLTTPNALARLTEFMDAHPRAGACGPRLVYGDGSFQHSAFGFPGIAQLILDLYPVDHRILNSRWNGRYPRSLYMAGKPFQIDHPLGAAFLVRRETAAQVGWLDEDFFIYVEEVDWAKRIRRAGKEIWCVPQAVITHLEAQSTRQFRDAMFVELWRARLHYYRKHHSPLYNAVAKVVIRAGMNRLEREARRRGANEDSARRIAAYGKVSRMTFKN